MATKEQYDAATNALRKLADHKISELPFFYQSFAHNALNEALMHEFAHVALDAAIKDPK